MKRVCNSTFRRLFLALVLLSLLPQSGTTNVFTEAITQASIQTNKVSILPVNPEAEAGQQVQLKTVATNEQGHQTEVKAGFWIALPNELATIDADGKVHLLAPGEVQIVAIVGGKQVRSTIRVKPARAASIEITRPTLPLPVGESIKLTVKTFDSQRNQSKDIGLNWESDNPTIAFVDGTGQVTGLSAGKASIKVRTGGVSANTVIEVVKSDVYSLSVQPDSTIVRTGDVVRFVAEAKNTSGNQANFTNVRWSVDGSAIVESNGAFVAQRPGTYTVKALAGGNSATSVVTVTPRSVKRELETVSQISLGSIRASKMWPFGKYLYVATFSDKLNIYDISDPKNSELTGSIKIDARSLPDFSLTPDGRIGVLTREGASNRQNGLLFLDTSDLAHPKPLATFTEVSGSIHSAFIEGNYVYLTDDATGSMRVVDFSDAKNPKQVARWELNLPTTKTQSEHAMPGMSSGSRHLHDIQVKDGLAYLAYWRDGLVILDVGAGLRGGSPENPKLVSQFRFNHADLYGKGWLAGSREVFRNKDYVFVGDEVIPAELDPGSSGRRLGRGMLHVIDVTDIFAPRRVAEYVLPEGGAYNVWAEGDLLAMGYYGDSGRVLDISGKLLGNLAEQGREIARLKTGLPTGGTQEAPFTFGARIFGNYIFFNDLQTGIWITKLGRQTK